jgi:hypothetical protein
MDLLKKLDELIEDGWLPREARRTEPIGINFFDAVYDDDRINDPVEKAGSVDGLPEKRNKEESLCQR